MSPTNRMPGRQDVHAVGAPRSSGLHRYVLDLAVAAGVPLALGTRCEWLSTRGHLAEVVQRQAPGEIVEALVAIHRVLGGDADALAAKRPANGPTPDLVHVPSGCIVEVDEVQHFTTARRDALALYPPAVPLGFDITEYHRLIDTCHPKADRAYAHRMSADFPFAGGRRGQRAYNDALRDLLAPTFTGYPLIRVPVPSRDLADVLDGLTAALPA